MESELKDRLKKGLMLCEIHSTRMKYAYSRVSHFFPLDIKKYNLLSEENLSFIDQLIFRFSKLQDAMGNKLFPSLLENLGEDIKDKPFIDRLNQLEKFGINENSKEWLQLRETRNIVTHEYPFINKEVIDGLNILAVHQQKLSSIFEMIKAKAKDKFNMEI